MSRSLRIEYPGGFYHVTAREREKGTGYFIGKLSVRSFLSICLTGVLFLFTASCRKGDGSIFRDKGEKNTSYFWLKNLSDGLNLLTSFLSQSSKRIE